MATSAGEVEVKLTLSTDDFNKALKQSQANLKGVSDDMGKSVVAIGAAAAAALAAVGMFLKGSLDSYAEYETSVTHLTSALNAQGISSANVTAHLTALANHLQELTGISDNSIISAQALLVTHGLQGAALDKVTQAALDLSTAMGIDLETAAGLLGKAFEGNTAALSRYGIKINEHISTSQKFAAVMTQVNDKFGGAAVAQADTYTGKLNIMKAAFDDFEKTIGQLLAGPVGALIVRMTDIIRVFTDWVNIMANVHTNMGSVGNMLVGFLSSIMGPFLNGLIDLQFKLTAILDKVPFLHTAVAMLNLDLFEQKQQLNQSIDAWTKSMTQAKKTTDAQKEGLKAVLAAAVDTSTGIVGAAESQTQTVHDLQLESIKLQSKQAADAKAAHEAFALSFVTTEADMWGFVQQTSTSVITGFSDGFAKMIVEGKSFADSMAAIFQQLAEQIISYIIQMIVKMLILLALESATGVGPAGGAAMSAFSGAMASGGVIGEPSIITGLRSGRRILAGEAGPEMVVPMGGGNKTAAEMGGMPSGGGGGGGITINISGQFIDGDSNSWQRLMREKIIPEIRRFTMSSPTGPFNRTRGVV